MMTLGMKTPPCCNFYIIIIMCHIVSAPGQKESKKTLNEILPQTIISRWNVYNQGGKFWDIANTSDKTIRMHSRHAMTIVLCTRIIIYNSRNINIKKKMIWRVWQLKNRKQIFVFEEEQANKRETFTFASVRWPNFLNASFKSPSVVVHERLPTKQRYSSASDIFNQLSCGVKQTCKIKNMTATSRKKWQFWVKIWLDKGEKYSRYI